jgi:hypothetical protein
MASVAVETTLRDELTHYPGVELELKNGGKHDRAVFRLGDRSRFLTIPKTPSDYRADKNIVRDLRKTLVELGAKRDDGIVRGKGSRGGKGRRTRNADAAFALNASSIVLTFGRFSKLRKRFGGKVKQQWTLEFRASPDLKAPPLVVLKKVDLPAGFERKKGVAAGTDFRGVWKFQFARALAPKMLKGVDYISSIDVELFKDEGDALVFKLPAGVLPTGYTPHTKVVEEDEPTPLPSQAWAEPRPVEERVEEPEAPKVAQAAPVPSTGLADRPIVLQFPKQTISVEQAIAVLNRKKQQLGNGLRFTIEEGGYISAVHRIGK